MVISQVNQNVYNGDGINKAWPYTFEIIDKTDVHLILQDVDGTQTVLTSDYYIDEVNATAYYPGYAPGAEPPEADQPPVVAVGQKLIVYRDLPLTQEADLGEKWPFYVIEKGLDKLTMLLQDVWGWTKRNFMMLKNGAVSWGGKDYRISDVANPLDQQDVATKNYVDSIIAGIVAHGSNITFCDTVAALRAADLQQGVYAATGGYYEINDGGAGVYNVRARVLADVDDGGSIIILDNGNVAELITDGTVNVKQYGVMPTDTTTDALAKINTILSLNKWHNITIPSDINYGYNRHYPNTYTPNVYACTIRVTVWDYSVDNSYNVGGEEGTNGNQIRIWSNTPNGDDGQYDGNGVILGGNHHPYFMVSNDGDPTIEKRASITFGTKRTINWMVGQGIYNNDENFRIDNRNHTFFAISKDNGNMAFGTNYLSRPLSIAKLPYIATDTNEKLIIADELVNPTVSNSFWSNATEFRINNNLLISPNIFKIGQTGRTIELINKSDTEDMSLRLTGLNSKYVLFGVDEKKLYLVHNGTNVLITDANNGILCYRGVSGGSASTANRPAAVTGGTMFFDTTLGKPIWYKGGDQWVDATGTVV